MKKYIKIALMVIVGILLLTVGILAVQNSKLQDDVEKYDNNFKALNLENSELKEKTIAYRFDVEQLEYINDSIVKDLNNVRRELNIKDKQLKQMQYIKTEIVTKDSIYFRDTIFKESLVKLDTLLGDEWYKIRLQAEYPNKISIDAKYTSDLNVFAHSAKEIIGTPKKCFIGRWFQKRHKVIRVEVYDKNPYSEIKEKKFIIIE